MYGLFINKGTIVPNMYITLTWTDTDLKLTADKILHLALTGKKLRFFEECTTLCVDCRLQIRVSLQYVGEMWEILILLLGKRPQLNQFYYHLSKS